VPCSLVHRESRRTYPIFLHDERQYLQRQWGVLHVMEREREHLDRDIERARSLAARAGIEIERRRPSRSRGRCGSCSR
jgi:GAF domain-containing protein